MLEGCQSAEEVIHHILKMEAKVQLKVIVLLWQWWNERNRVREGENRRDEQDLVFVILNSAENFLSMNKQPVEGETNPMRGWRKPQVGFLKINSDGSYVAQTNEGWWGFVIRDDEGR